MHETAVILWPPAPPGPCASPTSVALTPDRTLASRRTQSSQCGVGLFHSYLNNKKILTVVATQDIGIPGYGDQRRGW